LIDAVVAGDIDEATALMLEHINVSLRATQEPGAS
jgi:DNA-binding GntR family transcriptional regulator